MKLTKCGGIGEALEQIWALTQKTAQAAPAAAPVQQVGPTEVYKFDQQGRQVSNPPQGLQFPANQQPRGVQAPNLPGNRTPGQGQQLVQEWNKMMQIHGKDLSEVSAWAKKMSSQPMVAKDPNFSGALNQFAGLIDQLPNSPQGMPAAKEALAGIHAQLNNFWVKWQQAYQKGHGFLQNSDIRLKAFDKLLGNIDIKAFSKYPAAPAPAAPPAGQNAGNQNTGGFLV